MVFAAALVLAGCSGKTEPTPPAQPSPSSPASGVDQEGCPAPGDGLPTGYLPVGGALEGDLRGDGSAARALILGDEERPLRCRYFLVVEPVQGPGSHAPIEAAESLPNDVPSLLRAVEIDGDPGLEAVVDFGGPRHPHRSGQVFTFEEGSLVAMRVEPAQAGGIPPVIVPLGGEFAAGVDCAGEAGAIVVTVGELAEGGTDDRHFDITRTFYRAQGDRFVAIRRDTYRVPVGTEELRWPELADDPFRSCPGAQ